MELSEAIRLGAMMKPQGFGMTHHDGIHTCALNAALDAVGHGERSYIHAFDVFPLACTHVVNPVSGEDMTVLSAIRELNDYHGWTREAIADWVETIERARTPETARSNNGDSAEILSVKREQAVAASR